MSKDIINQVSQQQSGRRVVAAMFIDNGKVVLAKRFVNKRTALGKY